MSLTTDVFFTDDPMPISPAARSRHVPDVNRFPLNELEYTYMVQNMLHPMTHHPEDVIARFSEFSKRFKNHIDDVLRKHGLVNEAIPIIEEQAEWYISTADRNETSYEQYKKEITYIRDAVIYLLNNYLLRKQLDDQCKNYKFGLI